MCVKCKCMCVCVYDFTVRTLFLQVKDRDFRSGPDEHKQISSVRVTAIDRLPGANQML